MRLGRPGRLRVARHVGRALKRVVDPVTASGWAVLGLGLVASVLGRWRGWLESATAGAVLLVLFAACATMVVGRSTYAVTLDLADRRVRVGQRAFGRLEVTNISRGRLLPARIELPVGPGTAAFELPWMAPGAVHEDVFAVPTTRRCVVAVGPVRSVRGDPLGIFRRLVRWAEPVDLFVHPRLVALTGTSAGVLRDLEGQATGDLSNSDMSFHALRDYVAGDDRRNIHWKTSARTGRLMVRQFEDTRRTHTALALATNSDDYASDDEFELAVSAMASIGVETIKGERGLTVLAGSQKMHTDTAVRLLDDCSTVQSGDAEPSGAVLASLAARHAPDASVVMLIVGSAASASELTAATRVLHGVRTVLMTCAIGAPISVRSRGSLSLATIGSLADLPRVLRKLAA
jgi:uncharacterized protein (DUF58 family)